jgi:hypothetical protein
MNLLCLDLVHGILMYDRRFIIREKKLVEIGKINMNKYKFLLDIPKKEIIEDNIPEILLKIKDSENYFCLMSTDYNNEYAIELQKLSLNDGKTYFIDSIIHDIV